MRKFLDENKATIISVLTAILSLAVGLSSLDLGVKTGIIIAILVVVIPVLINILTEGFNQKTIDLIVNAVSIIQKILLANNMIAVGSEMETDDEAAKTEDITEVDPIREVIPIHFTKEEIKEMLLENIR